MFGRVALVGDAASTPRPHMGFGVSKAGAEAQALAEALSNYDDIDRALAAYNAARQALGERIVSHGRKLGMPKIPSDPGGAEIPLVARKSLELIGWSKRQIRAGSLIPVGWLA
jgi:2-polyprenyl-6-methoxyphenol hydroxylase-like FAD-dependent oxidoreductase